MNFFYFYLISIFIIGCQNQKEPSVQFPNNRLRIFTDSMESMAFKAPEKYFIQDGFYTFSSKEKDFKITLGVQVHCRQSPSRNSKHGLEGLK